MAYVDITQFKDHDYSVPYKTFNDLKADDNVSSALRSLNVL